MSDHSLDLRGVACPMNFVKTKLFLDKLSSNDLLQVYLDPGEPVESVSSSISAEGHQIISVEIQDSGHFLVIIRKL